MREFRGGDRGREYTHSHSYGSSSAGGEFVRPRTPEEEAADRVSTFRSHAELAANHASKLATITILEDWRAEKASVDKRRTELARAQPDREKDAAVSEKARADYDEAKKALDQIAAALAAAKEPRPKPPVAREIEIEPLIKDRSAHPDDVLAWAAGLNAGQRHALAERLTEATTKVTSSDRDEFGIELANYLASARILPQFRKVLLDPKRHFNAARYAAARAARDASAHADLSGASIAGASTEAATSSARSEVHSVARETY
jgi:hypothetical protein